MAPFFASMSASSDKFLEILYRVKKFKGKIMIRSRFISRSESVSFLIMTVDDEAYAELKKCHFRTVIGGNYYLWQDRAWLPPKKRQTSTKRPKGNNNSRGNNNNNNPNSNTNCNTTNSRAAKKSRC